MSYNKYRDNGMTDHLSWVHIPDQTIVEGDDAEPLGDRKYARLVYIAGSSADALELSAVIANVDPPKASIIIDNDPYTYVAEAVPGSSPISAVWRVKRIETSGGNTAITWADGDGNFDNVATDLSGLVYA
jgi:hypothetical protein